MKRATHRWIPYLFLCEAISTLWLCLNDRFLVITHWWYFILGFASLALLAILEHRTALPLPFMDHLTGDDFIFAFVLTGVGLILAPILGSLAYQYWQSMRFGLAPYLSAALSIHAGISEESFKVAFTNLVAKPFQKALGRKGSKRMDRAIVYAAGTSAVALWAWMHVPFAYLSIGSAVGVFLGGMVCLGVILVVRNYLPVVLMHVLYDLFVFLFFASSVF